MRKHLTCVLKYTYICVLFNTNFKHKDMKTAVIKAEIEKTAKELGVNEIEVIKAMQAELAKLGDEKGISFLAKIKMSYYNKTK